MKLKFNNGNHYDSKHPNPAYVSSFETFAIDSNSDDLCKTFYRNPSYHIFYAIKKSDRILQKRRNRMGAFKRNKTNFVPIDPNEKARDLHLTYHKEIGLSDAIF